MENLYKILKYKIIKNSKMSKLCELTHKTIQFGNNVSHSQRKTRRRFEPNLQNISFFSELTNKTHTFKSTPKALKTVNKSGGIDSYLISAKNNHLSKKAADLKKIIVNLFQKSAEIKK